MTVRHGLVFRRTRLVRSPIRAARDEIPSRLKRRYDSSTNKLRGQRARRRRGAPQLAQDHHDARQLPRRRCVAQAVFSRSRNADVRWPRSERRNGLGSRIYRLGAENLADHRQSVRHETVTHVLGTFCHPCLRVGQQNAGAARGIRTPDPIITNDVLYRLSYCGPGAVITPGWGHCKQGLRSSAHRRGGREASRTTSATSLPASARAWRLRFQWPAGAPDQDRPAHAGGSLALLAAPRVPQPPRPV